jgi:hypothetical protein
MSIIPGLFVMLKTKSIRNISSTVTNHTNNNKSSESKIKTTWRNTLNLFNSFKMVDLKFSRKPKAPISESNSLANSNNSKVNQEPFTEPLFFAMPHIIRKEFESFNETGTETSKRAALSVSTSANSAAHQFIPEFDFMEKVRKFREEAASEPPKNYFTGFRTIFNIFERNISAGKSEPLRQGKISRQIGRKVALLGFHGWFPNRLIQTVIGDPRRTSSRMVDMLESAILDSDPFPPFLEGPPDIYKFPLQGEGTIEERVERHFGELQKVAQVYAHEGATSIKHLQEADTIILGAHSQGAPVAIILLARLLKAGIINTQKQKVSVLTVSGIFHGPFPPLRKNLVIQYVEADAARQLFDLNNPDSNVSKLLFESLDTVLGAGINITCVASWLDQVVPFYSACLLGFDHPNIWRSMHINADHYKPDFLTKLIDVGLKIKNVQPEFGEPETHMILAQVSDYISGSIYQHTTHSSAYRKTDSYRTALEWMHSGPGIKNVPVRAVDHIRHRPLQSTVNPYYLPWLFHAWLKNSAFLQNPLLKDEFVSLQELYREWAPESKLLKDFKFRLEPISLLSKI